MEDKRKLRTKEYLQELAYRMVSQIANWSLLQCLSAVSASFVISNATVMY